MDDLVTFVRDGTGKKVAIPNFASINRHVHDLQRWHENDNPELFKANTEAAGWVWKDNDTDQNK